MTGLWAPGLPAGPAPLATTTRHSQKAFSFDMSMATMYVRGAQQRLPFPNDLWACLVNRRTRLLVHAAFFVALTQQVGGREWAFLLAKKPLEEPSIAGTIFTAWRMLNP